MWRTLAKSWIDLIRMRRFGEGCRWGWVRDYWTDPRNGGDSVRPRSDGPTYADVDQGVEELVFRSPVSEREEGSVKVSKGLWGAKTM